MPSTSNDTGLPRRLVAEVRTAMVANPAAYRSRMLDRYRAEHHHPMAWGLIAAGMDQARAFSRADFDVRREADAAIPPLERFAAGDAHLVAVFARVELDIVRSLARGVASDRRMALSRLRSWGVLRTTIKRADGLHRERARLRADGAVEAEQQRIIREEVPTWQWPHADRIAPGVHGFLETNRNGVLHVWTLVADRPLSGAAGRFLDGLPMTKRVRVFGVSRGSLCESMLTRRGFSRSRYAWHGLRDGVSATASAWTWMYR